MCLRGGRCSLRRERVNDQAFTFFYIEMDKKLTRLYKEFVKCGVSRDIALKLVLVHMGLKDAMTAGAVVEKILPLLRKKKYIYEIDDSYLQFQVHNFVEYTTKTYSPNAQTLRRFYIGRGIARKKLKQLRLNPYNFDQGVRFGFPMCDIIHYCRKATREGKNYLDIFSDWIEDLPGEAGAKRVDFRFVGSLIKYFNQLRLIEHVPHHPHCEASLTQAQRNLEILGELDPELKRRLIKGFSFPLLFYGDNWQKVGIVQLDGVERIASRRYSARCLRAIPAGLPKGIPLEIHLVPYKKVAIYARGNKIVEHTAPKETKWSYCLFFPYDSMSTS